MANEVKQKYGASVELQASGAISVDTFSSGARVDNDNSVNGYESIDMYVVVTAAPSSVAVCELWENNSADDVTYAADEYALSVIIPTATGTYHLGEVSLAKFSRYKLKAIDYGFTASLIGVPKLPEIQ